MCVDPGGVGELQRMLDNQDDLEPTLELLASERFRPALRMLREAVTYAEKTGSNKWDFAIEAHELRRTGLSRNDLRYLVRLDVIEHACEISASDKRERVFQSSGKLTFTKTSCFVMTEFGVALFGHANSSINGLHRTEKVRVSNQEAPAVVDVGSALQTYVPLWDGDRRVLTLNGLIVKQFKWAAVNQEAILAVFQEEGWPSRIDDPLPPESDQDTKRRLSDTIKCLNRKQTNRLIRFHGDGSGEGVIWEQTPLSDTNGCDH